GETYLSAFLDHPGEHGFEVVGLVDPAPQRCSRIDELRAKNIPIYADLKELYAHAQPKLTMLATPIHLHASQTCVARAAGSSVLCEKPLGATLEDARRMLAADRATEGFTSIGYQWSFSAAIQALKRDIMAGDFGRPVCLKTLCFAPRTAAYYHRNTWAG